MATEQHGNEVTEPSLIPGMEEQATCIHSLPVYFREGKPIHFGSGIPCEVNAVTEQMPKVVEHWQPPGVNPMQEDAEALHDFIRGESSKLIVDLPPEGIQVKPWPHPDPVLGFRDENGRSLLEVRIKDGQLEMKYYPSDLDEAAHKFLDYLRQMHG